MTPTTRRRNEIVERVVSAGKVEVSTLATSLGVSTVTIRKDLDHLAERGLVRRERGAAIPLSPDDHAGRLAYHYAQKDQIARAAAQTVSDGELVMVEAGSCCTLLAERVAAERRNTTIVTNSAFIADRIRRAPHTSTVLLGGEYQPESQVLVGPLLELCVTQFLADTLFIGTDGYTPRLGFTNRDQQRAAAVRAMADRAEHVVILTESEKFRSHGPIPLIAASRVSAVWTDADIPNASIGELRDQGVEVHTVDADGYVTHHV